MSHHAFFALWFFLPAGIANMTPIIVAQVPALQHFKAPLDGGLQYRKKRIFGDHKTWRGLLSGVVVAILVIWLQYLLFRHEAWARTVSVPLSYGSAKILWLGFLLGLGALLGDALESFLKRQYNVAAGDSWFPFDQLDYIIGGLLLATIYVRLPAPDYGWIIVIWFGMHMAFSYFGYALKLKDKPI